MLIIGLGIGAALLIRLGLGAIRRAGWDEPRRLHAVRVVTDALAGAWVVLMLFRLGFQVAPKTTLLVGGGALAGLLFAISRWLPGIMSSITLVARGDLRQGDILRLGDIEGVIEQVALLRVRLRLRDGSRALIPTADLASGQLNLRSPERATPVHLRLERATPWPAQETQRLAQTAALCPYRALGSPVTVTLEDGDKALRIHLGAWSASAAAEAERWLRSAIDPPPP